MAIENTKIPKGIDDVNPDDVKKLLGLILAGIPVVVKIFKDLKK